MARSKKETVTTAPTPAELEILQLLWSHGPSTVRFINDRMSEKGKEVQYTSTLKQMQVMTEKGLLVRDETQMKHVYAPAEKEQKTRDWLLQKFVDTFYSGSPTKLMMQLLGNKKTSKEDLKDIKEQLDRMEEE